MRFYKCRFLKEGEMFGPAYTYKSEKEYRVGDKVLVAGGKKVVVTGFETDFSRIKFYGVDKVKLILEKVED